MQILRSYIFQINFVDTSTLRHIMGHLGRRDDIVQRPVRVGGQLMSVGSFACQGTARGLQPPQGVHLAHLLDDLKQPRPAGDAVGFQRGGHRQADGLFGAGSVRHHQVGSQRVQTALHTLHRGVK